MWIEKLKITSIFMPSCNLLFFNNDVHGQFSIFSAYLKFVENKKGKEKLQTIEIFKF